MLGRLIPSRRKVSPMSTEKFLFTSESVTEGHPDKIADQVSDAILDAILSQDKGARVACETMITTGFALIAGEITTTSVIDYAAIVRNTIQEIGYDNSDKGFDYETCGVMISLDKQSPDISQGVSVGQGLFKEQGAGDQGLMFGYATDETPEFMPAPIDYAHKLTKSLADHRKLGKAKWLRPDGKSQVTIEYIDDKPVHINTVVISTQHDPEIEHKQIEEYCIEEICKKELPSQLVDDKTRFLINPTGRFVVGGPHGDCGLTGRKIIVDTYGGQGSHGGGAFSGKDPSKVDRSASYMGRYIAKNIVAAGIASRCEVQIAYAIGFPEPVSIMINTFGTSEIPHSKITEAVRQVFPLKPSGIIEELDLLRPIYHKTAAYGHFGRNDPDFSWERTHKADDLKKALGL